jgi:hypothetical protein
VPTVQDPVSSVKSDPESVAVVAVDPPSGAELLPSTMVNTDQPGHTGTDVFATRSDTDEDDPYAHLFEATVYRSAEEAAVRAPEAAADDQALITAVPVFEPTVSSAETGDHDGHTILGSSLRDLIGSVDPVAALVPAAAAYLSVRLSTGQVLVLDRPVVIGRKPSVSRVSGTDMPQLVVVPSPTLDISRAHLEVRASGDGAVVVDLRSMNGSVVTLPGGEQQLLRDGGELAIPPGTRLDIGDGVAVFLDDLRPADLPS